MNYQTLEHFVMSIQSKQLFICTPSPPTSLSHFVEFWAERYSWGSEGSEILYTQNINAPHTPDSLGELFKWKIGNRFFATKLPDLKKHFIDRLGEAEELLRGLAGSECRDIARCFLDRFKEGGPVYRIFWLHCLNTRFPIYDQHVHRAMVFIQDNGRMEELSKLKPEQQVQLYLDRYLSFFDEFRGMDSRKVDQALWQSGKFVKDGGLPPIRKPAEH